MEKTYHHFKRRVCSVLILLVLLFFYQQQMELREARAEAYQNAERAERSETQLTELTDRLDDFTKKLETINGTKRVQDEKEVTAAVVYQDGTYTGEGTGFGGMIQVEIVIDKGEISDIFIIEAQKEDSAYLESALAILDSIKMAQSAEVDTVSGATFSSTGIKDAVRQALQKAVAGS